LEAAVASSPKLAYAFLPTPNPIRATAAGANPNTVDLQVIVSNPTLSAVTLAKVIINVPTGEETSRSISTARSLPPPTYDTTIPWTITTSGSDVTLAPKGRQSGQILGPIIFILPGIQVNHTVGTVPLTVTEFPPSAPKVADASYSLLKQPSDFPVTSFTATPPTLGDLDVPVILKWTCTEAGRLDAYSVYSDDWQPRDCINEGDCYTWQDGQSGVETPDLNETTVFSLDVVRTDNTGHRSVAGTLQTTVWLAVPTFSGLSRLTQSFSSRQVKLYWLAYNASYCSVAVNGVTVVPRAPVDTYRQGFPLTLTGGVGTYQVSVTAYAVTGPAQTTFVFPQVMVGARAVMPAGESPTGIAVTADGTLAAITSLPRWTMTIVDVATRQVMKTINISDFAWSVAVTPDGALALATRAQSSSVAVVDLKKRELEPRAIATTAPGAMIAISPDGKLAFVGNQVGDRMTVIDIATRTAEPRTIAIQESAYGIAFTPDSKLALVGSDIRALVTVIDVARRAVDGVPIPVPGSSRGIAVSPDGKLALLPDWGGNTVSVVDIAARKAEPQTIPVGARPTSVTFTPDGRMALTANFGDGTLTIIDVASRAAIGTVPAPGLSDNGGPSMAMMPNNVNALVLNTEAGTVSLI
jgi:DNA-binding beta-propeller fold protein YncE